MRIALLGAGHIGGTIARLLAESDDYQLTVVDCSKQALLTVAGLPLVGVVADLSDRPTLAALLQPADLVINALPFHLAAYVADIAKQTRTHYFDLTEDVRATREIAALAHMAETAFMPQCGLAPGFVSIAANQLAASFEQVQDIKMRVGALPEFPCNALKYNLTWSIDGLINEYCHPCEALQDGHTRANGRPGIFFGGWRRVRGIQHLWWFGHAMRDTGQQHSKSGLQVHTLSGPPVAHEIPARRAWSQTRSGTAQEHPA